MFKRLVNWLAHEKIHQLEQQLAEANQEIARLMYHQRQAQIKLDEERERRHEAEMKVAASRYGETFGVYKKGSTIHSGPANPLSPMHASHIQTLLRPPGSVAPELPDSV